MRRDLFRRVHGSFLLHIDGKPFETGNSINKTAIGRQVARGTDTRPRISPKLCFPLGKNRDEKKKKNKLGDRKRKSEGIGKGRREKEQRKMFPPSSRNLWMNNSISFQRSPRAPVLSVHANLCIPNLSILWAHLCTVLGRYKSQVTRVYNPTPDTMNYRRTLNIVPAASNHPFHVLFFTRFLRRPASLPNIQLEKKKVARLCDF